MEYSVLNRIQKANDIKKIKAEQYPKLAEEIRDFLVQTVSEKGGHLSSNLGVVELTMALHLYLNFPKDKLIFDVGHQAYVHKILTGRRADFASLREHSGLAGFPKVAESPCDSFNTGHSSTSVSVATGFAEARMLNGTDEKIVAVIGDGALGGGLAFEAFNNLSKIRSNVIVILNDNSMSIDKNVGGMANYLAHIRTATAYTNFKTSLQDTLERIPQVGDKIVKRLKNSKNKVKSLVVGGMLFENLGITYIGPIDGHNVREVYKALKSAEKVKHPVIIHCITKKGKGYSFAEENPGKFHGISPFEIETGKIKSKATQKTYTQEFSQTMVELGKTNSKICAITAAMEFGTGLDVFSKQYPERFFDVGIAEQHAVTSAAGMAARGFHPVVAIYSSFLQRAYDQILHDVCIMKLPVTFMIDRAGIVGADGETHQGIFDYSFLGHIPNLTVMAPKNCAELSEMLKYAVTKDYPVAIRYPRGAESSEGSLAPVSEIIDGKAEIIKEGTDVSIVFAGALYNEASELVTLLTEKGLSVGLINARFVSPIDCEAVKIAARAKVVVTLEENVKHGGFGESVATEILENGYNTRLVVGALEDRFIEQGTRSELMKLYGLDVQKLSEKVLSILEK